MKRRDFIALTGGAAVGWPLAARAQQPKKTPLLAILFPGKDDSRGLIAALRLGLRERGYIEGDNIRIEYRFAGEQVDRLGPLAAELVALHPDVLFTGTTPGVLAAKKATNSIPIVVGAAGDFVQSGVARSYARPGGNVTGLVFTESLALDRKHLELLKEVIPTLARVLFLVNPDNPNWNRTPAALADTARSLGIRTERFEVSAVDQLEAALATKRGDADAIVVANDLIYNQNLARISELAAAAHMPAISQQKQFAKAGGLLAYGTSVPEMWRRAATYVDKILKSAKPGDLPIERPMQIELTVNLKTAKALGVTIPRSVLLRADEVIE